MAFTIKCNECGAEQEFENNSSPCGEYIGIGLTESHSFQGSVVESIDLYCSNCETEVNV